jgi:UDP-N-acetylmuramoyl-tripeptide--D-alanyl-D-alanine ligase
LNCLIIKGGDLSMRLDEHFLKNALPEVSFLYKVFPEDISFCIDSRKLEKGDVFIALEGAVFDGHDFIADVVQKGAAGLIIAESKKNCLAKIAKTLLENIVVMLVPNTRSALIQLATAWRAQFSYPVICITGSVGKTSTKEMLCNILDVHGIFYAASSGNHNTMIGLALSILTMREEHHVAIFELGINKRGEMAHLVAMAKPTVALVTCIGHAHMEGLGSIVDIAAEKRDIFSLFKEHNIGIINGDQSLLAQISYGHPVIKFGSKTTNQIQARKIYQGSTHVSFILKLYGEKFRITLKTNHNGAVFNTLAAVSLAHLLNVPSQTIVDAIQMPVVVAGRFEQRSLKNGNGVIINDCYNASPESMKAALLALQKIETSATKIAVLGDMGELGINSPFWHRQLGRFLRKVPTLQSVILVGSLVEWTKKTIPVGLPVEHVANWQEATNILQNSLTNDSLILVKGSRMVGLDNLVNSMAHKSDTRDIS